MVENVGDLVQLIESEYAELPGPAFVQEAVAAPVNLDARSMDLIVGAALEAANFLKRMPNDVYIGRRRVLTDRGLMKTIANAAACVALLAGGFAAPAVAGQQTGPASPPPVVEPMYGPDLYRHYCATCHGREGKGDGPAAGALKVPPSDLTVLARREKGVFPSSAVEAIIRGGMEVAAHGSVEMPVWGPIFYALDPSDARVRARIAALVSHIATIQQK